MRRHKFFFMLNCVNIVKCFIHAHKQKKGRQTKKKGYAKQHKFFFYKNINEIKSTQFKESYKNK